MKASEQDQPAKPASGPEKKQPFWKKPSKDITVRPYRAGDRDTVRHICCETGFMGDPIEPLFIDRRAFADFFTRYYTDYEPEHCVVVEVGGKVVGYILCCVDHRRYARRQTRIILRNAPRVAWRMISGRYNAQSWRFLSWFLFRAAGETPKAPKESAHFHMNILDGQRSRAVIARLIFSFLEILPHWGARRIYGQIQTFGERRRTAKMFERYGFNLYDSKRITKFERFGKYEVYVSTVVRDLAAEQ